MPSPEDLKNFNRKRNITIYIIIVITFIIVSFYLFSNKKLDSTDNDKVENSSVSSNKIDDISLNYYEEDVQKIVTDFINNYHKIDSISRLESFKNTKDILTTDCYENLFDTVYAEDNLPRNGYVYRTIEKKTFYDYQYDSSTNRIKITSKVYSNWLDEDKNLVAKNELTEYKFSIIMLKNELKIDSVKSKII